MVQPPFSGPTRFFASARRSSKKTWQKSDSPLISLIGEIVTAGGRVLATCALGDNVDEARRRAYGAMDEVEFLGKHNRTDIPVR